MAKGYSKHALGNMTTLATHVGSPLVLYYTYVLVCTCHSLRCGNWQCRSADEAHNHDYSTESCSLGNCFSLQIHCVQLCNLRAGNGHHCLKYGWRLQHTLRQWNHTVYHTVLSLKKLCPVPAELVKVMWSQAPENEFFCLAVLQGWDI